MGCERRPTCAIHSPGFFYHLQKLTFLFQINKLYFTREK